MTFTTRRLTPGDVDAYRAIRLEALRLEPTAFASDDGREGALDDAEWRGRLERNHVVGAFDGDRLVGVAMFFVEGMDKTRHRGHVVAVYVRPEARGRGAGRGLMDAIIAEARGKAAQLHLAVTDGNGAARRLYERAGFEVYGVDPRALRVDGRYYDEQLMVLRLDEGGTECEFHV